MVTIFCLVYVSVFQRICIQLYLSFLCYLFYVFFFMNNLFVCISCKICNNDDTREQLKCQSIYVFFCVNFSAVSCVCVSKAGVVGKVDTCHSNS